MAGVLLMTAGGTGMVWASSAVVKLKSNNTEVNPLGRSITAVETSLLTATPVFAGTLGSLIFPLMADKISRKKALKIMGFGMFLSQIGLAFSRIIPLMVTFISTKSMFFFGIMAVLPIYLAEICEDHNRNKYGCLMAGFLSLGQVYSYFIGPFFNLKNYTLLLSVPLLPFFLLFNLAPESPVYSLANKREEECLKTLNKLRNYKTNTEIYIEFNRLNQSLTNNRKNRNFLTIFKLKEGRIGLLLAMLPILAQYVSGVPIVMTLMAPIFNEAGISISGNTIAIMVGLFKICIFALTSCIVEKTGRRQLLLLSAAGACIPALSLGLFFYLKHINSSFVDDNQWLPIVSILLYILFYSIGLGPLPIAIMSELFPNDIRSSAIAFVTSVCGLIMATYSFMFPIFAEMIGIHWCLWVFGIVCFVSAILFYLFLPETKGKSIHEIQEILKKY